MRRCTTTRRARFRLIIACTARVFLLLLEELLANWEQVLELQELIETRVEESAATPCVLSARSLYLCALAQRPSGQRQRG